jgi:hypothetical protein
MTGLTFSGSRPGQAVFQRGMQGHPAWWQPRLQARHAGGRRGGCSLTWQDVASISPRFEGRAKWSNKLAKDVGHYEAVQCKPLTDNDVSGHEFTGDNLSCMNQLDSGRAAVQSAVLSCRRQCFVVHVYADAFASPEFRSS